MEQSTLDKYPPWSSTENSIRKEIAIMRKCRHPNLVRLLEVIDDPQQEKIYIGKTRCFINLALWSFLECPILFLSGQRLRNIYSCHSVTTFFPQSWNTFQEDLWNGQIPITSLY
jgi:serine/threonine protein kinase